MLLHIAVEDRMKKSKEIDPTQAREKVKRGQATLVCAYEEIEKCSKVLLDGAIPIAQLKARLKDRNKDEELVFYCA
jgi:hypothetical protein